MSVKSLPLIPVYSTFVFSWVMSLYILLLFTEGVLGTMKIEIFGPESISIHETFSANISCCYRSQNYSLSWNVSSVSVSDCMSWHEGWGSEAVSRNFISGHVAMECKEMVWLRLQKCGSYVLNVMVLNNDIKNSFEGERSVIANASHAFTVVSTRDQGHEALVTMGCIFIAVAAFSSILISYYMHVTAALRIETPESANFDFRYVVGVAILGHPSRPRSSLSGSSVSGWASKTISAINHSMMDLVGRSGGVGRREEYIAMQYTVPRSTYSSLTSSEANSENAFYSGSSLLMISTTRD